MRDVIDHADQAADPSRSVIATLLNPGSVAVIGASEDQGKFGGRAFRLLLHHGFRGEVYPVNPNRSELFGLRAYPSVAATPRPADVALLAIPKPLLRRSIAECAAAGVRAAIVITTHFAEVGPDGAREEQELVELARAAGMRLLGPNCLGLISPANGVVLTSSPALDVERLLSGETGLVSQSGALMATLFDRASALGIGFSHCVSVGNQADLEAADVVDYLVADDRTRAICSYVEGFKDPARILAAAQRARAAGKPWFMVKAGRTAAGGRAAVSHTASLAGDYAVLEAVARNSGIVLMDDPDAMILAAATLARFGRTPIRRVSVVTTSGGAGAITADRLTDRGVELARFGPETAAALDRSFMPGQAGNPVDLGGRREGEAVGVAADALAAVAADPETDLVLLVLSTAPALARIAADLADAAAATGKPHLFVIWPGPAADLAREELRARGAPFCDRLEDAVRAAAGWLDWSRLAERLADRLAGLPVEPRPDGLDAGLTSLAALPAGVLDEAATKLLLAACGVPANAGRLVASPNEAVAAAGAIGYPVALKAAGSELIHKSDAGAVVLGLADAAAVREASAEIVERVGHHAPVLRIEKMLVQAMVAGEAELIVGVKHDPQFGPVVLVGSGGILAEALPDVQLAPAPVGPRAATALLQRLRMWPVLAGVRGRPALDVAAVADVVSRVSWLAAESEGRLLELDVNPLVVSPNGAVAVDARAVVR